MFFGKVAQPQVPWSCSVYTADLKSSNSLSPSVASHRRHLLFLECPECGSALFSFWNGVPTSSQGCFLLQAGSQTTSPVPSQACSRSHLLQSLSHHPILSNSEPQNKWGKNPSCLLMVFALCLFLPLPVYMFCKGLEFLTRHNR